MISFVNNIKNNFSIDNHNEFGMMVCDNPMQDNQNQVTSDSVLIEDKENQYRNQTKSKTVSSSRPSHFQKRIIIISSSKERETEPLNMKVLLSHPTEELQRN